MSVSLSLSVRASTDSKEFKKHFNILKMCVESEVSYPKETEEFFHGAIDEGEAISEYDGEYVLEKLEHGSEMKVKTKSDYHGQRITLNVCDIPEGADKIIVELC